MDNLCFMDSWLKFCLFSTIAIIMQSVKHIAMYIAIVPVANVCYNTRMHAYTELMFARTLYPSELQHHAQLENEELW